MNSIGELPTDWLPRIRSEFDESPGLRLTVHEASRLWGLDPMHCESLLRVLVEIRFLKRGRHGAYLRDHD